MNSFINSNYYYRLPYFPETSHDRFAYEFCNVYNQSKWNIMGSQACIQWLRMSPGIEYKN